MIEAYESIQQRLRQELFRSRAIGTENEHAESLDRILDHWLKGLHALYDSSRESDR